MTKILITSTNLPDLSAISLDSSADLIFYEELLKITTLNTFIIQDFLFHQQKNIDGIIISSQNALCALNNRFLNKDIKIFTVGKNTAQKICNLGYKNVFFPAKYRAEELLQIILAKHSVLKNKHLVYLHGSAITLDFSQILLAKNIKVSSFLAYQTSFSDNFSENLQQFLTLNNFDKIFIFSSNALLAFFHKMQNNNLQHRLIASHIYCISNKVMSLAQNYGFRNVNTILT